MKNKTTIDQNVNYQKIGRKTLFLGILISVLIFYVIIPGTIGLILLLAGETLSVITYYRNTIKEVNSNLTFVLIQVLIQLGGIWLIGPKLAKLIIKRNKNYYWISVLSIISLWMLLFISSSVTSGIQNSFKYGKDGFESALISWFIYGFLIFMIIGLVHGLIIGFFLGRKIKLDGNKLTPTST